MAKNWWLEEDNGPKHRADFSFNWGEDEHGRKQRMRLTRRAFWLIVPLIVIAISWVMWHQIAKGLPTLDQLENPHPEVATRLVSSDGEPIDQYYIKNRTTVHLKNIPPDLIKALLATEDRDFYNHWGINLYGNMRALWKDFVTLSPRQGASSITQQLARNLYLTQEKSALRKIREAISAVEIERTHTKNEILEMYLNVAYLGRGAYGIEAASQVYFGKDVNQLTTAQSAYLIGLLKGPENYDPDDDYDYAVARRNTVIENMVNAGYMTTGTAAKVKQEPLKVQEMKGYQGIAPHFAEMIRQDLAKKPELQGYDLYRDGLVVYTTLNAAMQRAANRAVDEHIASYQKKVNSHWDWEKHKLMLDTILTKAVRSNSAYRAASGVNEKHRVEHNLKANKEFIDSVKLAELRLQTGLVCIDQSTGQILAMVGSSNYREARYGLNHVTQIQRQPGSSFKSIVYASCFEHGSSPETSVSNEPINMRDGDHTWSPGNFEGEAVGGMRTIRQALKFSINLCAIHAILELTTPANVVKLAKQLGIKSNIGAYPSIALGTAEVSPLEITSAYSTFANEGVHAEPYAIIQVEDRNGKILYRARPALDNVFEPRIAHMMTSALSDVVNGGTGSSVRAAGFHYDAAGKTGTTQNYADAWFVGFTPHFTAGAWVGFDNKRITFTPSDGQGARAAAPMWGKFMKYAYDVMKPKILYFPTGYGNSAHPTDSLATPRLTDSSGPLIPTIPHRGDTSHPGQPPKPSTPTPSQMITPH